METGKAMRNTSFAIPEITAKPSRAIEMPSTNIGRVVAATVVKEEREHISSKDNGINLGVEAKIPTQEYFKKVSSLYPDKVLDKGWYRGARSGFRNYVLIDADVVSHSNIATQGVFVSEMGKKKVEVIRDSILDINRDATVICVDKFMDDKMSDEEFKGYMDRFPMCLAF